MFDSARLKSQIFLKGKQVGEAREAAGLGKASWHNRMHGKSSFTVEEVVRLAKFLDLSMDEVKTIFFGDEVF